MQRLEDLLDISNNPDLTTMGQGFEVNFWRCLLQIGDAARLRGVSIRHLQKLRIDP